MSTTQVKQTRPWAASPMDRAMTALSVLISALTSVLIVAITPMKGKLAYFALFFIAWFIVDSLFIIRKKGAKGVRDGLAEKITLLGAVIVSMAVFSILWATLSRGLKGFNLAFFTENMRQASLFDPIGKGGILHAILGTLMLIAIAIIISVPMGILTALYLTEIKGKATGLIQFLVQAMSGVPSVVAGLFIYAAIILNTPLRSSAFLGGLALTILMVPTVTRTAQEVLNLVPRDLREAGLAMGATQWKTVALVVVPAARSGLITATILGVARIAGETAPLLFTVGVFDSYNFNPFKGDQGTIPTVVWAGLLGGTPESIQRAWSAILVLLIVVLIMFVLARAFGAKSPKK
ncbi:MAG: phosphate ABC transporter permease PstA [Actinobacteria bacterium]|nr:phosphate ABC transporter permease PstA [Actinomycetota bacterium]MTA94532.1 phosphate ABC transporter permease PstA [Actinomycetota bacterium]